MSYLAKSLVFSPKFKSCKEMWNPPRSQFNDTKNVQILNLNFVVANVFFVARSRKVNFMQDYLETVKETY